jgi:RHS repeat-associated protein
VDQKFLYDGWNLVAELNATNNTVVRSHVWGLDLSGSLQGAGGVGGLLWLRDTSTFNNQPSTHFASYDGNGNVTMLVNAADGTETARYEYGPFGELLRATGPMARANPFRFSTKYQDDETDLLMYALRPYSPPTGRFLCKDPIGEHGGRNLYGFVGNDPLDRFDPLGLMSVDDFNNGVTSISEGLNDIGFLEGALRWFFGSGRDVHVPFKNYDPDWGPSDFDGFDAAVKSVCSKCPTWQPGLEFTRVRDLYMEGGKTIFIKGGPGRINVRLKGNMSSFAHYCPCKWRFRGDVTIPRDSFNFDPQWFNSDRSGSGELITRIIWLIHLLGVGTDFNVYFDGSRFVDASGDCPKN